ncbi:MAG: hypothetical protein R3E79_38550 [Caldilineaceae bacterium]
MSHFAWSPDGEALLFDRWQGGARRVYRISLDGTDLQPLTTFDSWGGAWSPDGQQVVVSSPQGLYQLDRQGEHPVQVSAVVGEQPHGQRMAAGWPTSPVRAKGRRCGCWNWPAVRPQS